MAIPNARMGFGGEAILRPEIHPGTYKRPEGFSVSVTVKTKADAERVFNELANGGRVTMPLGATFWSAAFGMVTNKFGVSWMVNCEHSA